MLLHLTCPQTLKDAPTGARSVFLAGGISGCADWQSEAKRMLDAMSSERGQGLAPLALLNPRREDFDLTDTELSVSQIRWEHEHLRLAQAIFFWFPHETLCPITLYELGVWSALGKPLMVGCDPRYARALDVREQTALIRPDVAVRDSLAAVCEDLMLWAGAKEKRP